MGQLGYGQDIFVKSRDFCSDFVGLFLETENRGKEFVEEKGIAGRNRVTGEREGYLWYLLKVGYIHIYPLFWGHIFNE